MRLSKSIGKTPMIRISDRIFAKAELMNPTGSIKDRPASFIINEAERNGDLKPGDTIIEATSGNMGVSFAWLAAERGYKCIIVMPSNMSEERKKTLSYYGAKLVEVDPGDFDSAIRLRDKMAIEEGYFNCNQFSNPLNIESHRRTTATEIIDFFNTTEFFPTAFISGTGTGGTLMGAGRRLKEKYPILKILAVEPDESPVMSGGQPGLHGIQGIGDGSKFLVDMKHVDSVIRISTKEAIDSAKRIAREYGLFVGISAGANVLAAERWCEKNPGTVVTFLCDRGDRYYSCL